MEIGLLIKWGKLVPDREEKAVELFSVATEYFGKKLANKVITFFEPFFLSTGDHERETGFFIIKGPFDRVFKMMEEEEYKVLMDKAFYLVEHLTVDMLIVGEGITEQLARAAKVRAELGLAV